ATPARRGRSGGGGRRRESWLLQRQVPVAPALSARGFDRVVAFGLEVAFAEVVLLGVVNWAIEWRPRCGRDGNRGAWSLRSQEVSIEESWLLVSSHAHSALTRR